MVFVNCTPHALTIEGVGTLPASGIVPRCATVRSETAPVGGVRIVRQVAGDVTGLPAPEAGTAYIGAIEWYAKSIKDLSIQDIINGTTEKERASVRSFINQVDLFHDKLIAKI